MPQQNRPVAIIISRNELRVLVFQGNGIEKRKEFESNKILSEPQYFLLCIFFYKDRVGLHFVISVCMCEWCVSVCVFIVCLCV